MSAHTPRRVRRAEARLQAWLSKAPPLRPIDYEIADGIEITAWEAQPWPRRYRKAARVIERWETR